jgi:hypothetical protein
LQISKLAEGQALLVILVRFPEDELVVLEEDSPVVALADGCVAVLQVKPAAVLTGEGELDITAAHLHSDGVVRVQNDFALAAFFLAIHDVTPFFLLSSSEKKKKIKGGGLPSF